MAARVLSKSGFLKIKTVKHMMLLPFQKFRISTGLKVVFLASCSLFAHAYAADGDLENELRTVEARYRELLTNLRAKAVAASDKQTVAKIDAILKEASKPLEVAAEGNPLLPRVQSKFDGTLTFNDSVQKVTSTVTKSQGEEFTLRSEMDGGAVWDWGFKFTKDGKLEVVDFVRVRTQRGVKRGPGTGAVTGSGELKDGELTWRFSWPHDNETMRGKFELNQKN